MLVFEERAKPEYPEKNLLERSGRRVLSPLRHPCSPQGHQAQTRKKILKNYFQTVLTNEQRQKKVIYDG